MKCHICELLWTFTKTCVIVRERQKYWLTANSWLMTSKTPNSSFKKPNPLSQFRRCGENVKQKKRSPLHLFILAPYLVIRCLENFPLMCEVRQINLFKKPNHIVVSWKFNWFHNVIVALELIAYFIFGSIKISYMAGKYLFLKILYKHIKYLSIRDDSYKFQNFVKNPNGFTVTTRLHFVR